MSDRFRAFRVSSDGRCFCGSTDSGIIRIWDAGDLSLIAALDTGFPEGFHRLAIDTGNHLLFSGAWGEGLSCHNYRSGARLWHRSDLRGIQSVEHSNGWPLSIHVAVDVLETEQNLPDVFSGIAELDSRSGETLWHAKDGLSVFLHPTEPLLVMEASQEPEWIRRRPWWMPRIFAWISGHGMPSSETGSDRSLAILDQSKERCASLEMANFAILDVAFVGDLMALAEGEKGVRVIRRDGSVLAHHASAGRESNFIQAGFDRSTGTWVFLDQWEEAFVIILDGATGRLLNEYRRASRGGIHLIGDGSRYVDDQGQVCRTSNGELLAQLDM